nr:hypothetical protein [uncultured Hyphomonas sp.]
MGRWQNLQALCLKILRTRAAQAALSVSGHVLVLGGLLLANPWRQAPILPEPPLIVDLVTFTVAEEKEKKASDVPAPGRPTTPPPEPAPPAPAPQPSRKPAAESPPASDIILEPLETPAVDAPPDGGSGIAAAPGPGASGVDPAVGQAIAALICRRMDEDERYAAGCAEQPTIDPFERPPAIALLPPEERRIQAIRTQQLARTAGYGNFLEWYLEHDAAIPKTLPGGIDNSIFMDRKDEATMQQERLMRGGTPDWAADIARAHGQE